MFSPNLTSFIAKWYKTPEDGLLETIQNEDSIRKRRLVAGPGDRDHDRTESSLSAYGPTMVTSGLDPLETLFSL